MQARRALSIFLIEKHEEASVMKIKIFVLYIMAMVIAVIASSDPVQQSANQLYQSGIYKEDVEGKLEEAIAVYQQIIESFPKDGPVAAKAWFHMGLCYEKLGNLQAQNAYRQVLSNYADQKEIASQARARLAALATKAAEPRFTKIRVPTGLPTNGFFTLSPDGRQLAYIEKGSVWIVPVHGQTDPTIAGAPRQITPQNRSWTETTDITWSGDGKWLAWKAKERNSGKLVYAIYMVPASGGGDPRLVPLELKSRERIFHDCRLSLSPDGKWLAYTTWPDSGSPADRAVYLAPTDGGPARRLTKPITSDPAFSPDGKNIAYLRLAGSSDWQPGAERGRQLWITHVNGGSPTLVYEFSLPGRIEGPTWSPDGRMLAVLVNHDDRTDECREMLIIPVGPDGRASGPPAKLTLPHYTSFKPAGWSSGNQIGLMLARDMESAIYTVPSSGGKAVQLTPDWAMSPDWTPDGRRIYFEGSHFDIGAEIEYVPSWGGKIEKVELRAPGSNPVALYGPGTISISPNGKMVMFGGSYRGSAKRFGQIFSVPVEGGDVVELTSPQGAQARSACWAPDGKSIAFIGNENRGLDVYIKPVKGSQARKLTSQLDQVSWGGIAWSPDGSRIAFYSDKGRTIKVIPVTGGPAEVLVNGCTEGIRLDHGLAWSPDGKQLLYSTENRIWKLDLATGKSEKLETGLNLIQTEMAWSPDGKTIAFSGMKEAATELWLMEDFLPNLLPAGSLVATQLARSQKRTGPKFREVAIPGKLPLGSQLSPDGRSIAYAIDGSLWSMPLSGKVSPEIPGVPVRLDTGGLGVLPFGLAWSADGEWIAFNSLKTEEGKFKYGMYSVSSNGGKPRRFPRTPFRGGFISAFRLALSPHGKLLAFLSSLGDYEPSRLDDIRGKWGVVIASVEDGTVRRTIESASRPAFSPDGKKIAYRVGDGAIWVSPIGGGKAQLAMDLGKEKGASNPFWSPDSRMVAVQPHNGDKELYIVPVDKIGKAAAPPTRIELPHEGAPAGWTRDGKIGFLFRETKDALYTVSSSGGKPVQITLDKGRCPEWSPDGGKIFFNSNGKLRMVPADGGKVLTLPISPNELNLISDEDISDTCGCAVSPDGKTIVFSGRIKGKPGVDLWTIPAQRGKPIRLTSMPPPAEAHYASWSPDGKRIAFLRWPDPPKTEIPTNIYIIPAQGGDIRKVTADTDNVALSSIALVPGRKADRLLYPRS
jgi:Tol biopolymer transport system component